MMGQQFNVILLGGLAGRLDQTIHLLSYLHKLRKTRRSIVAVTDDNVGWVLDSVRHLCDSFPFSRLTLHRENIS